MIALTIYFHSLLTRGDMQIDGLGLVFSVIIHNAESRSAGSTGGLYRSQRVDRTDRV